jgi:uncharacterized protein YycO
MTCFAVAMLAACLLIPSAAFAASNLITFNNFTEGDIVVVRTGAGSLGHAGMFCQARYSGLNSYAMISSNVSPKWGVQYETCQYYRTYEEAWGLRVKGMGYSNRLTARKWAEAQLGKPYGPTPIKTDKSSFYCSQLMWAAWYWTYKVDIDGNGGTVVLPMDIVIDGSLSSLGYWK